MDAWKDGGYRCPSTPVQAGRRTTRRRTVGRSHSVRWERVSGGQKAKMSATSLDQVSSKARKRAPEQHRRGGGREMMATCLPLLSARAWVLDGSSMLGGWVNPHREQQTIPQGQTSIPPKSFSTPTANGQIAP